MLESKKRVNTKQDKENKDRIRYLQDRSKCKNFILKKATEEDLGELEKLIKERRENG